jgi:hypothetical protein
MDESQLWTLQSDPKKVDAQSNEEAIRDKRSCLSHTG